MRYDDVVEKFGSNAGLALPEQNVLRIASVVGNIEDAQSVEELVHFCIAGTERR
jgi:hypothetical protein